MLQHSLLIVGLLVPSLGFSQTLPEAQPISKKYERLFDFRIHAETSQIVMTTPSEVLLSDLSGQNLKEVVPVLKPGHEITESLLGPEGRLLFYEHEDSNDWDIFGTELFDLQTGKSIPNVSNVFIDATHVLTVTYDYSDSQQERTRLESVDGITGDIEILGNWYKGLSFHPVELRENQQSSKLYLHGETLPSSGIPPRLLAIDRKTKAVSELVRIPVIQGEPSFISFIGISPSEKFAIYKVCNFKTDQIFLADLSTGTLSQIDERATKNGCSSALNNSAWSRSAFYFKDVNEKWKLLNFSTGVLEDSPVAFPDRQTMEFLDNNKMVVFKPCESELRRICSFEEVDLKTGQSGWSVKNPYKAISVFYSKKKNRLFVVDIGGRNKSATFIEVNLQTGELKPFAQIKQAGLEYFGGMDCKFSPSEEEIFCKSPDMFVETPEPYSGQVFRVRL